MLDVPVDPPFLPVRMSDFLSNVKSLLCISKGSCQKRIVARGREVRTAMQTYIVLYPDTQILRL